AFGFVFAVFFGAVGALPLVWMAPPRGWGFALGIAFALAALFAPRLLGPLNRLWTGFGALLHRIMSPLILGVMFLAVFAPIGIALRLLRKDPLRLRLDAAAKSYWIDRQPAGPVPESLDRQF
ncbi:MAG TPA: SxtJ family membrane protein, partial [Burkholderiaceae bacterium]|nr:SxtJ family membrane protein [Burkholderiaceae bacterium]